MSWVMHNDCMGLTNQASHFGACSENPKFLFRRNYTTKQSKLWKENRTQVYRKGSIKGK